MQPIKFENDLLATSSRIARSHLCKGRSGSCISNGCQRYAVDERRRSSCADGDGERCSYSYPRIAYVEAQGDDVQFAEMATDWP